MLQLPKENQTTSNVAEVLTATACRLIRWGTSEREAHALAKVVTLEPDAVDAVVESAAIEVWSASKKRLMASPRLSTSADNGGIRCDWTATPKARDGNDDPKFTSIPARQWRP
jgi:hypothetical protein